MNNKKVKKIQFSSGLAGTALLFKKRIEFDITGLIVGGSIEYKQAIPITDGQKYFSDATFYTAGSMNTKSRPWKHAPRSQYFLPETSSPIPRVYLNKSNFSDRVEVSAFVTNVTNSNFTIVGNYKVVVDVYIFSSNQAL